jgi:hypothetical protein
MKLKFAPTLQNEIDVANWRRAERAAALFLLGITVTCVACSYVYGALMGGA